LAKAKGSPKTGGRVAGTPNRLGREVKDIWERLGGPDGEVYAQQLHNIAAAQHGDIHARLKALQIIAPHVWRKMSERLEVTGADGGPLVIKWQS